ncbi:MAG: flagellar basal body-associated FliL family protein [Desulfobacterales bacterium]
MAHDKKTNGQLADEFNEPEDFKKKGLPEKKASNKLPGKSRWTRKLFLIFMWGTFIFIAVLSYPFLKDHQAILETPSVSGQVSPVIPMVKRFPVQNDRSIRFDSFIIPFEEHGKFTYISLSISFELPNKELVYEMTQKNALIRGIIYSILSQNIKLLTSVSSLEKLKELITHSVNGVLTAGKVREPIITDFSTV